MTRTLGRVRNMLRSHVQAVWMLLQVGRVFNWWLLTHLKLRYMATTPRAGMTTFATASTSM